MRYKAFLSYSHAADNQLAPMLQTALQRFAKAFYRLRAIRIFRDKTSLHLTPELWPTIQQALHESEYFLLLASEEAAKSAWVQKEIDEWLALHDGSVSRVLILLTDGEIRWDAEAGDFDWTATTALPPTLRGRFRAEPFFLDFREMRSANDLSLRHPLFLDHVGTIAAALHGRPKEEMVGEDVRAHRIFRLASAGVAVILLLLTVFALIAAYVASEQRRVAQARQLLAEAELAQIESESSSGSWADLRQRSFLLTDLAVQRAGAAMGPQTAALDRSIRSVARSIPRAERVLQLDSEPGYADYSSDGRRLLLMFDDRIGIYNARSMREIGRLPLIEADSWTPTLSHLAGSTSDGTFRVWHVGGTVAELKGLAQQRRILESEISPDGKLLATADDEHVLRVTRIADGTQILEVPHANRIDHIKFDETGARVATTVWDSIRIFALPRATPERIIPFGAYRLAFSPDGRLVAGATYTAIAVWDLRSGEPLQEIQVLKSSEGEGIVHLTFGADSRSVVAFTNESWVAAYDVRTGEKIWPTTTSSDWWTDEFTVATRSNSGTVAAREIPHGIELWGTSDGRKITSVDWEDEGLVDAVAYDAVTHTVALAEGKKLRLIDVNPGDELAGAGLDGETESVASSEDGEIWVVKTDKELGVWTWKMSRWWRPPPTFQNAATFAVSADGTRVALWSEESLTQWSVSKATGEVRPGPALRFGRQHAAPPEPLESMVSRVSLLYSKSGRYCAAVANDGLYVWLSDTGEQVFKGATDAYVTALSFDAEERSIWYYDWEGPVWRQDLPIRGAKAMPPEQVAATSGGATFFFSPEGKFAVIRDGKTNTNQVWDRRTWTLLQEIPLGDSSENMDFEVRDRFVVVNRQGTIPASEDPSTVKVYDLEKRRPAFEVQHARHVDVFAFSGDGAVLATADDVGGDTETAMVHLTATSTGQPIGKLLFTGPVKGMALSSDGRRLCIYGKTGVARIWDLSQPEEPREIAQLHHGRRVRWARFDPGAGRLMTVDGDSAETRTHNWILSTEELLSRIRPRIRRKLTESEQKDLFRDQGFGQTIVQAIQHAIAAFRDPG